MNLYKVWGFLLCLYTLFLAMFMIMFIKNVVSEYDIKLEREKNKQLNLYTKEIEELYNSLRTFKHDYKNILNKYVVVYFGKRYRWT